jgi:hypothetical protein
VPKGEFGGDLIQRIVGPAGQIIGSILWEAKRTKNWSDGWLGKLREDQRAAKADVCLIVSQALPKGVQTFDYIDGVWVTDPKCALAVAVALRESLVALSAAREEQINGVVETMAGLYGDLQGIAGRSLQEIEGLELPLLDGPPTSEAAE